MGTATERMIHRLANATVMAWVEERIIEVDGRAQSAYSTYLIAPKSEFADPKQEPERDLVGTALIMRILDWMFPGDGEEQLEHLRCMAEQWDNRPKFRDEGMN